MKLQLTIPTLTLFLSLLLFTNCNVAGGPGTDELVDHYDRMTVHTQSMTQMILNMFERDMVIDPRMVKPYYDRSQQAHHLIDPFIYEALTMEQDTK